MVSLVKTNLLILTEVMQHPFFLAIILCSSVHMYTMDQLLAILGQLAQMLVNLQTRTFTARALDFGGNAQQFRLPKFPSCGLPSSLPPSLSPSMHAGHIQESIKIPLLSLMISSSSSKHIFLLDDTAYISTSTWASPNKTPFIKFFVFRYSTLLTEVT